MPDLQSPDVTTCEPRPMATPTLQEIRDLTRSALSSSPFDDPTILGAGRAALDLLSRDPETCLQLAYQQLHAVPYKEVKTCWRRLYTDAALWQILQIAETNDDVWIAKTVKMLDMALILTGAVGREELVEEWFAALEDALTSNSLDQNEYGVNSRSSRAQSEVKDDPQRPAKKRKMDPSEVNHLPETFPLIVDTGPTIRYPIPRIQRLSLSDFEKKVANPATQTPLIIKGAINHWPAFEDHRAWKKPSYLLRKTLNGLRLVPIEVGRSYTDAGWSQKILSFRDFMDEYMLHPSSSPILHTNGTKGSGYQDYTDTTAPPSPEKKGYLAQHDLFAQIPSLRADIAIPDYCYSTPASQPLNLSNVKPVDDLAEPLLNAWFGPAGTISPLHTDPYHNILSQVVGYKYVRLYAPGETPGLYPRGVEGDGVDMSNTSRVDLDEAMGVWGEISCWEEVVGEVTDEKRTEIEERYPEFRHAKYVEGVLEPGECLYIPTGWWHYVRSLTPSFSVSFWWN